MGRAVDAGPFPYVCHGSRAVWCWARVQDLLWKCVIPAENESALSKKPNQTTKHPEFSACREKWVAGGEGIPISVSGRGGQNGAEAVCCAALVTPVGAVVALLVALGVRVGLI